jgi:hypothetical protein
MDLECALDAKVQNWIQLSIVDIVMVATYNTFFTFYEHHTFSRLRFMNHDTPHLDMVQSCKDLICNLFCALVKFGSFF